MHSFLQATRDTTLPHEHHAVLSQVVIAEPELETPWLDNLRKASFTPTLFSNNFDACQTAIERPDVHLVLLSLRSPMMDGIPASRLLRQSRPSSDVAIVLLWNSKSKDESLVADAYASGVTDIIRSPYSADELIARLRAALKGTSRSGATKSNHPVSKVADTVREGSRLEAEVKQALAELREHSAEFTTDEVAASETDESDEFDRSQQASVTHRVDDTVRQGSPFETEVRQALASIRKQDKPEVAAEKSPTTSVEPAEVVPTEPQPSSSAKTHRDETNGTEWLLSHDLPHGLRAPRFDSSRLKFVLPVTEREHATDQEHVGRSEVLLDRVWVCPQCHALPSFRPACPCCGSARVERDSLMHHFACAYVGQISEFRVTPDGGLACPKCCAQRLIVGTDCEALHGPHRCNDCDWSPQELEIIGHCLKCGLRFPAHQAHLEDLVGQH